MPSIFASERKFENKNTIIGYLSSKGVHSGSLPVLHFSISKFILRLFVFFKLKPDI